MLKLRALALVAGIVGVIVGTWIAYEDAASTSWPTIDGVVQNSTVTPTRRNWRVELQYTYIIQSQTFRGHSYRPGGNLVSSEAKARRISAAYTPGSRVTVHYNPADPRNSALETGLELNDGIMPFIGILGLAYAFWPRRAKG